MMLPPIFQTLKTSADVKAIVGTNPPRVYRHGDAPQDTTRPYVTWFVVTDDPHNNLSSTPTGDRVSLQIDCWHQTDAGVVALATAVRDTIEPFAHMTAIPVNNRDAETRLYRIAMTFDWFLDRDA